MTKVRLAKPVAGLEVKKEDKISAYFLEAKDNTHELSIDEWTPKYLPKHAKGSGGPAQNIRRGRRRKSPFLTRLLVQPQQRIILSRCRMQRKRNEHPGNIDVHVYLKSG